MFRRWFYSLFPDLWLSRETTLQQSQIPLHWNRICAIVRMSSTYRTLLHDTITAQRSLQERTRCTNCKDKFNPEFSNQFCFICIVKKASNGKWVEHTGTDLLPYSPLSCPFLWLLSRSISCSFIRLIKSTGNGGKSGIWADFPSGYWCCFKDIQDNG